jgi:uncharacterized protein
LQAIGLEKDELVQALGLSFAVSTIALAVNVALEGELRLSIASDTIAGLALACAGCGSGRQSACECRRRRSANGSLRV